MVVGGYIAAWIALSIATAFLMGRFFAAADPIDDRWDEGGNLKRAFPPCGGQALAFGRAPAGLAGSATSILNASLPCGRASSLSALTTSAAAQSLTSGGAPCLTPFHDRSTATGGQ